MRFTRNLLDILLQRFAQAVDITLENLAPELSERVRAIEGAAH